MRSRFRVAAAVALIVSAGGLTAAAAPHAAPAQAAGPCCIVFGESWFTGPTQAADCAAARQALLGNWDFVSPCTPVGDRTHLAFNRIIS
jgi:hypothetical protein